MPLRAATPTSASVSCRVRGVSLPRNQHDVPLVGMVNIDRHLSCKHRHRETKLLGPLLALPYLLCQVDLRQGPDARSAAAKSARPEHPLGTGRASIDPEVLNGLSVLTKTISSDMSSTCAESSSDMPGPPAKHGNVGALRRMVDYLHTNCSRLCVVVTSA